MGELPEVPMFLQKMPCGTPCMNGLSGQQYARKKVLQLCVGIQWQNLRDFIAV